MKININKNEALYFDIFEHEVDVKKVSQFLFKYHFWATSNIGKVYYMRIKLQERQGVWVKTSKSFATSLNAKKWESKLTDILPKRDN